MKKLTGEAMRLAEQYILSNARVLERHRFACLFGSGNADRVVAALRPYRNEDGGFGHALEPDGRGPGSQPATVSGALTILDEVGAMSGDLVAGVCDYLTSISAGDGGVPFVHPNIRDYPRAPWWQIPDSYEGSLLPTGAIAGLLHKNKIDHPWLATATEFCWQKIDSLVDTMPYEALAAIQFLDRVPDRARAEAAAARLGTIVRDRKFVSLPDVPAEGEQHYPEDYAPTPDSLARQWFSDAEFDAGLDRLVESQQDDGSWPVGWPIWTPATAFEWGGWLTVEALKKLVSHGRA